MNAWLLPLTLITTALVVLALVVYLSAIAFYLIKARRHVADIADGLEAVAGHAAPLPDKLGTINGALSQLLDGLKVANGHVGRSARVFKLIP